MQLLSVSSLLVLATTVTAKDWNINIYSDTACKKYISSWHDGDNPWTFGYSYGIHCAKVTNGPDGGSCQFWQDDGCSEELGNEDQVLDLLDMVDYYTPMSGNQRLACLKSGSRACWVIQM